MPSSTVRAVCGALVAMGAAAAPASAATETEIGELFRYATVLGRAAACNLDIQWPTRLVSQWMDDTFTPGTEEQQRLLGAFVEQMLANAALQRQAPAVSCAEVARLVQSFDWPAPGL
jgi:hypothetical protein